MNKKEFMEVQEQMAKSLIVYERFCKRANILKAQYVVNFNQYMESELKLQLENELIFNIINMLNDKKSLDEVDKIIVKAKQIYAKTIVNLNSDYNRSTAVVAKLDSEDNENLEAEFEKYVFKHHPAIKMAVSKKEADIYNLLKTFYYDNNYNAFMSAYEMNSNLLVDVEYSEEKYADYYRYYLNTADQIQKDIDKKIKLFPFTKKDVFEDDITVASEEADLKVKINKLKGINKALHVDLLKVYGEDISIS